MSRWSWRQRCDRADEATSCLDRDDFGAVVLAIKEYKGGVLIISHNEEIRTTRSSVMELTPKSGGLSFAHRGRVSGRQKRAGPPLFDGSS